MKLSYKIFAANLMVCFILLFSVFGVVRYNVGLHFKQAEQKMQERMLTLLAGKMAAEYRRSSGWHRFEKSLSFFEDFVLNILHSNAPLFPFPLHPGPPVFEKDAFKPPHKRLVLFSADRTRVAGPQMDLKPESGYPVLADQQIVGWLVFEKMKHPPPLFHHSMVKTRLRTFYTLGVVLFILAAVVSYLLSRHILSPVDELTRGTDALAQFKFSTRIKVRTTDELGRLAADFNRMAQTLERFETMRRQWIVDISHELRTPLAVLKGEIEALLEGVRPTCPEQIRSLHAEVIHLEKIVNDLHMISSADTQALVLKKQAVDPFEIVSSVLHSFGSRLENAGLKIEILDNLPEIRVMADEIRLRQLFSNIIENNIKYTESPGVIRVNGDAGYQSVTIVIADTGPGVPEDCLEKIFDRLFRLDAARQRESGGTGLGLSICKTIARAHGGDIFASLSEAGGLGITLVLPLEES